MLKRLATIPLWSIIALNFALKFFIFLYIAPWQPTVQEKCMFSWKDALQYEQLAESLLQKHKFTVPEDTLRAQHLNELQQSWLLVDQSGSLRVPVYPLFAAGIYFVTGIKPYLVLLAQIFITLLSVFLVYKISILLFNNKGIATLAALIYSLDIQTAYCTNLFCPDTMLVVFLLAAVYFFIRGINSGKLWEFAVSAFLLALGCLSKPVPLLFPAVIIAASLLCFKTNWKHKIICMATYLIVFFGVTGIWAARNYKEFGHFALTSQYGTNLLMANLTYSIAKHSHENIDSIKVGYQREANKNGFLATEDPFKRTKIYADIAYKVLAKHKAAYLVDNIEGSTIGLYFSLGYMAMAKMFQWAENPSKEATFGISTSISGLEKNLSANKKQTCLAVLLFLQLLLEYALTLFALFLLVRQKEFRVLILILLPICYFMVMTGNLPLGPYRFKLPITPFLCMLAGYGLFYIAERKNNKNSSSAIV